jgi:hypothetical protein
MTSDVAECGRTCFGDHINEQQQNHDHENGDTRCLVWNNHNRIYILLQRSCVRGVVFALESEERGRVISLLTPDDNVCCGPEPHSLHVGVLRPHAINNNRRRYCYCGCSWKCTEFYSHAEVFRISAGTALERGNLHLAGLKSKLGQGFIQTCSFR